MDPFIAEAIGPVIALTLLMTGGLVGLRMWLNRPRARQLDVPEVQQLVESVEQLQEHVLQLRGEMSDLHERMDFAERLLTKGKD